MSRLRRRSLAVALLAATVVPALGAQLTPERDDATPATAGLSVQFGGVGLDVGALNRALGARGRAQVPTTAATVGIDAWVKLKRVILATSAQTYAERRAEAAFFDTEATGGSATLDLGLPVLASRTTLLYPMVGVGASRLDVTLRQRGNAPFETINAGPAIDGTLTAWRWQGHLGAGLVRVVRPSWWNVQLTLDARAGYVAPFGDTDWQRGRWNVTDAPAVGQRGAYVRLGAGLVLARRTYAIAPMVLSMLPYTTR